MKEMETGRTRRTAFGRLLRILGPGLITGAADDDPSGIATYSQTGAQFGYGQLWVSLYALPLMVAVQEACARIGKVTGKGIIAVVKEHYGKKIAVAAVLLVLVANTVNIGADIGAMASALRLVVPVGFVPATLGFTALMLVLQIFMSYRRYARILKWLALSMLSYVATALIIKEPWGELARATFVPHISLSFPFLFIIVGVIGTTISPYMFFWEADEEVEEERAKHTGKGADGRPLVTRDGVRRMRWDNFLGMLTSNIVTWCIIVTASTVLFSHGVTDVATAADAAKALEPLVDTFPNAGFLAKALFASGIIGLGLLAVPVLSSSASYAVAEAFDWRASLNFKLKRAHGFYGVITIATVIGLLIDFVGIDPIKALVVTAVINGLIAVPLIFLIARIANSRSIMGQWKSGWASNIFVWLTFAVMAAAAVAMLASARL
ncbi:MAG: divalent metal cation transporter [Patescibacteria group bacterium]|nr:divalent metal cation transporter [Patescibacteria group bacterium]